MSQNLELFKKEKRCSNGNKGKCSPGELLIPGTYHFPFGVMMKICFLNIIHAMKRKTATVAFLIAGSYRTIIIDPPWPIEKRGTAEEL